jgi:shikimate kinase
MGKIILLGYMGCGKSTVAKIISKKLQFIHMDLDEMIEKATGLSITELFDKKGEIYFRKLEHQLLTETVVQHQNFVLSLGGGTPCYYNNHEVLEHQDVTSFYLKASIDTLFSRLYDQKNQRPLIAALNEVSLKEFIAKHLFDRSFYYYKAQFVTDANPGPEETAAAILKYLT